MYISVVEALFKCISSCAFYCGASEEVLKECDNAWKKEEKHENITEEGKV
jgi:hypothetical protein